MKTFKYRIYPTNSQIGKLENSFSMCRHLYNWSLDERQKAYEEEGKSISYNYQQNNLPSLKEERPWFKGVYSQVLQDVLKRVDRSYQNFFRRVKEKKEKAGFPKFKKKGQWSSITYPQFNKFPEDNKITIPKIGDVKIKYHRAIPITGIIKTLTIKKDGGKWFACFSVEVNAKKPELKQDLSKSIGIDLGLIDFYYGSDGNHVPVPKYFRKNEKKLKRLQRKFQKIRDEYRGKEKPLKYHKILKSIQKVHYRIRSQREDFIHKEANRLLRNYDIIIHEDLNIKNMNRRPKPKQDENGKYLPNRAGIKAGLNKSINDAGWYKFTQILKYKALVMGKTVIAIDPKKTSQICSGCGNRVEKSLSERTHICPFCGLILPRDYNSALYIKGLGLESLSGVSSALEAPTIIR